MCDEKAIETLGSKERQIYKQINEQISNVCTNIYSFIFCFFFVKIRNYMCKTTNTKIKNCDS